MHKFTELKVYQKSLLFTKIVRDTIKNFPKDELFGLSSQFKRAADSIVLNITEGAGDSSQKEFGKFLGYSIRSGFECIGCIEIARENNFVTNIQYENLSNTVNEIIAMLYSLRKIL